MHDDDSRAERLRSMLLLQTTVKHHVDWPALDRHFRNSCGKGIKEVMDGIDAGENIFVADNETEETMAYRLHYHRNGKEMTSDHPSIEDAVQFALAGEMAQEMSVDFLADAEGNVVLDEDALSKAVWGWGLDDA